VKLYQQQQTEAAFMAQVTDYARRRGWEWMHISPGLNERGRYRTPVSGSLGSGWPDLIMVRGSELLAVELKTDKGPVTALQHRVLTTLEGALVECHIWRPKDWDRILERLA
jgi:hypothetical protein